MMREYLLPLLTDFGFISHLKGDPAMADHEVTPEYLFDSAWLVGSPDTVAEKLAEQYETLGGFGTLLLFGFDYADDPEVWRQSMERMAKEVMPKVASLVPDSVPTATG